MMRPIFAAAFATLVLGLATQAFAGTVEVRDAWIRTPPPGAPTAAGYAVIVNKGDAPDRLVGASTAAAASVEAHQTSMAGGVMRMRPIPGGLVVPASGQVSLAPGGDHLMLTGLTRPLKAGDRVRITLEFARGGHVPVDFTVRDQASGSDMQGMQM